MRISRSAIVRSARTSPGEETKTRMVFIVFRNGKGPLDPVPETPLIDQPAKPVRSPVNESRKFGAVDARKSQMPALHSFAHQTGNYPGNYHLQNPASLS